MEFAERYLTPPMSFKTVEEAYHAQNYCLDLLPWDLPRAPQLSIGDAAAAQVRYTVRVALLEAGLIQPARQGRGTPLREWALTMIAYMRVEGREDAEIRRSVLDAAKKGLQGEPASLVRILDSAGSPVAYTFTAAGLLRDALDRLGEPRRDPVWQESSYAEIARAVEEGIARTDGEFRRTPMESWPELGDDTED
jgi:hypothetical protein